MCTKKSVMCTVLCVQLLKFGVHFFLVQMCTTWQLWTQSIDFNWLKVNRLCLFLPIPLYWSILNYSLANSYFEFHNYTFKLFFCILKLLLNLEFQEVKDTDVYHEEVKLVFYNIIWQGEDFKDS